MSFGAQQMTFIQKCYFQLKKSIIRLFLANFSTKWLILGKVQNVMHIIDTDVISCATYDFHSEMLFAAQKVNHLAVFGKF